MFIEEQDLIHKILSGETEAYTEIVRSYQGKVLGLCTSLLNNASEAEDAAQEIFVKAYQALGSFHGDSKFSTWLYRIAANHCKDLLRKRSRQKTESLDALIERSGDEVQNLWEPSFDPRNSAGAAELVKKLLDSLSPDEMLILTLREVQGLSYQEISETLKCSLDAVKSRLRRARETLQEKSRHFLQAGTSK
ncbi:MAG: RNA polymerase subunit sigma-24 [Candidatus Omnitrophica bacterium CG07_land_8_20_14_0_80_50_8]|nr:MAG: RNA polymerase subunit sigma-24 [Candidatus Omnitrophica bacterium CG07_land_8_20_14_0_80_50_8]